MRARWALLEAGLLVQWREIALKAKPAEMLAVSPKGTVPVLALPDGSVIEESLTVMHWACLLYTSPSPRDVEESRMPSSA